MSQTKYANAYAEVYEVLSFLNEEEYSKIPEDLIEVFKENRNLDYKYELNEDQDLTKQPMLIETKAILLNIFRDYLATSEQSIKIKKWLQEDREYFEKRKKEKYSINVFENREKKANIAKEDVQLVVCTKEQSIFQRIINKLKKIFKR